MQTTTQVHVDDAFVERLQSGDEAVKLGTLQRVLDSSLVLHAFTKSDVAMKTLCAIVASENKSMQVQRFALDVLFACIKLDVGMLMQYDIVPLVLTTMQVHTGDALHLMRFLRRLKEDKPAIKLYRMRADVARILLQRLLYPGTSCATTRVLMELLELLVHEGKGRKNAINEALLEMIGAATGTVWKLGPHLPDVVDILREGDCVEQFILMKCLSGNKYAVLEAFVLLHQGGLVLARLSQQNEHPDVKQLALDLEREVVSRNPEFRSRFRKMPLVEGTYQQESDDSHLHYGEVVDAVEKLQRGTEGDRFKMLKNLASNPHRFIRACSKHGIFTILSRQLESASTSTDFKSCIWTVLLDFAKNLRFYQITEVPEVRTLIAIILRAFEDDDRSFQESAMEMLRSLLFHDSVENRDLLVDSGILGTLVNLLVREENATRAKALIAYLCGFIAVDTSYRHELDAYVETLLENATVPGSLIQYDAMYFQNLVPLYCDISGLQLGQLGSLDRAVCVRLAFEVFKSENEVAQVAAILFLYDAMGLSDRCSQMLETQHSDLIAIRRCVFERIDDLVAASTNGPERGRELTRRILLAVDLSSLTHSLRDAVDFGDDTQQLALGSYEDDQQHDRGQDAKTGDDERESNGEEAKDADSVACNDELPRPIAGSEDEHAENANDASAGSPRSMRRVDEQGEADEIEDDEAYESGADDFQVDADAAASLAHYVDLLLQAPRDGQLAKKQRLE